MIMEELIKLDEYCSSVRDGTHDTPKPTEAGFFLVTSRAVKNNSIDFCSCYYISEKDYNKINERSKVDKWDVLMTMIGTVGRLLLVKDEPEYAIKNMALFKVGNEDRAKWLYYYLSTSAIQSYFEMIASGTSQHFIGLGHLRNLKIEDYNHASKRITDILSTFDSLIELNNKRVKALEQMAENLYKEWFVRFRFPGHENAEFENGIPKGWEYHQLNSIAQIEMGQSPESKYFNYEGKGLPFHQGVGGYGGLYLVDEVYSSQGKRYAEPNSIIFSVRAPVGRLNISLNRIILGRGVASINSKDKNNWFLFSMLKNRFNSDDMIGNGSIFASVKKEELQKQKFLIPPKKIIDQFDLI